MAATHPANLGHPRPLRIGVAAGLAAAALALAMSCAPGVRDGESLSLREITPAFLHALDARDLTLAADARGTVALVWVTHDSSLADVWLTVSRDSGASF